METNTPPLPEKGLACLSFAGTPPEHFREQLPNGDCFRYIVTTQGNAHVVIDSLTYPLPSPGLVVLAPEHQLTWRNSSSDFQCNVLAVTKLYLDQLPAADTLYQHITKVVMYPRRVNPLSRPQALVLCECLHRLQTKLTIQHHYLRHEMIQHALTGFLLELSNVWEENSWQQVDGSQLGRYENLLKAFLDLLMQHYREEHWVPFYASKLHVTPQYLTLIIKRLTGQTVNCFIYERLYCEARSLLEKPHLSIQEVADLLNFSDQSAFGKFFKRKSGLSPFDYRKSLSVRNDTTLPEKQI